MAVHAGEITAICIGAASAVVTDALARIDARRLALLGCGEQAKSHARAISKVRKIESMVVWEQSPERAEKFAQRMQAELGVPIKPAGNVQETIADADIVSTVTSAREPILKGARVRPGTHLNVVGSGDTGPAEVDNELVVKSRFIVDGREGVLEQGAEFLRAKQASRIDDDHIASEIGQVLAATIEGRRSADEITLYKSLGHIVQDLATAWACLHRRNN